MIACDYLVSTMLLIRRLSIIMTNYDRLLHVYCNKFSDNAAIIVNL